MSAPKERATFLTQDEIPTSWYNIQADLPERLPPPLDPGTHNPMSPEPLFRIFAKELVAQEVSQERWIKDPRRGARGISVAAETHAAIPRVQARELPEDPRKDLLQVGGRQPDGQPQAEHGAGPGLLQQEGRHRKAGHRDRGGPMGLRALDVVSLLRAEDEGLHGGRELQAKARPKDDDGDVGRRMHLLPEQQDEVREVAPRERPG